MASRLITLVLLASVLVLGCGKDEPLPAAKLRPVRYQPAYAAGADRIRSFAGTAQAGQEQQLSFKVGGTVAELAVKVGDRVAKNALVARLDTRDLELQVQEAEAALRSQEATERNAQANLERTERLYESDNVSISDLETARTQHITAQAAARSSASALQIARRQLDYGVLRAPAAGFVAQVQVEQNENVTAGQAVVVVNAGDRPEVLVAMPEVLIAQVHRGDGVSVTFDAITERTFAAEITEVGVSTGSASTYPVTVTLAQRDPDIRAGMAAEVLFTFEAQTDTEAILVPTSSVGEDVAGRFVFVLIDLADGEATARRTDVQVGEITSAGMEIMQGLVDGDLVVTAGVHKLTDGVRVLAGGER